MPNQGINIKTNVIKLVPGQTILIQMPTDTCQVSQKEFKKLVKDVKEKATPMIIQQVMGEFKKIIAEMTASQGPCPSQSPSDCITAGSQHFAPKLADPNSTPIESLSSPSVPSFSNSSTHSNSSIGRSKSKTRGKYTPTPITKGPGGRIPKSKRPTPFKRPEKSHNKHNNNHGYTPRDINDPTRLKQLPLSSNGCPVPTIPPQQSTVNKSQSPSKNALSSIPNSSSNTLPSQASPDYPVIHLEESVTETVFCSNESHCDTPPTGSNPSSPTPQRTHTQQPYEPSAATADSESAPIDSLDLTPKDVIHDYYGFKNLDESNSPSNDKSSDPNNHPTSYSAETTPEDALRCLEEAIHQSYRELGLDDDFLYF